MSTSKVSTPVDVPVPDLVPVPIETSILSKEQWLSFFHTLHNKTRNAPHLKLTGLPCVVNRLTS